MTWQIWYITPSSHVGVILSGFHGQEDPMKPVLDGVTARVVSSLSGEAKQFYDREFNFFDEVTSISGKLKPFIKKTKPEKKVTCLTTSTRQVIDICSCRRKLTRRWRKSKWTLVYISRAIRTVWLSTSIKNLGDLYKATQRLVAWYYCL